MLHRTLLRPDNPALRGGGEPHHLCLFVNVKIYHPSRPIVLKAVSVQENLSNNSKHLPKCRPEYGALSTRAFSIWVGSFPPPQKKGWRSKTTTSLNTRMCITTENT